MPPKQMNSKVNDAVEAEQQPQAVAQKGKGKGKEKTGGSRPKAKKTKVDDMPEEEEMPKEMRAKKPLNPIPVYIAKQVKQSLEGQVSVKNVEEIRAICKAFIDTIINNTLEGNAVALPNVATFKRVVRKARQHRNPKNSEPVYKSARYALSVEFRQKVKDQFVAAYLEENPDAAHVGPDTLTDTK